MKEKQQQLDNKIYIKQLPKQAVVCPHGKYLTFDRSSLHTLHIGRESRTGLTFLISTCKGDGSLSIMYYALMPFANIM